MNHPWTIRHRLLPSFTDLVFSTTLAFLFVFGKGATRLLADSDTGWHIRTGEWILKNLAVPRQDLYSFSKPAGEWFAWEWLSDVLFAVVHRQAGLAGLVLLAGLVIAVVFTLLHRMLIARGSNVLVAVGLVVTASYAASVHWLARPHMFSWLFALVFYWVLEQVPVERRRIYWLAPLTMLWTNLHGSFVLGLMLIAVYGAGEVIRAAVAGGALLRRQALGRAARYGLLLAACGASSLLNPYFFRLHLHILAYLNDPYILNHISEFFSPNFHGSATRFFEVLLLLGLGAFFHAARRGRYAQALLVAGFAHLSLQSARHIPLYVLFAAPAIADWLTEALAPPAEALTGWLGRALAAFARVGAEVRAIELRPRVHAVSALTVLAVSALIWAPAPAAGGPLTDFRPEFSPQIFPVAATDFLEKSAFAGNVFATDQWSSYLIYRAFPRMRVFIDGRSDYYGADLGKLYLDMLSAHHAWQATLDRYRVDSVLLPVGSGLVGALKQSPQWQVAYDDGIAILFFPRVPGAAAQLVARAQDTDRRQQSGRPPLVSTLKENQQ